MSIHLRIPYSTRILKTCHLLSSRLYCRFRSHTRSAACAVHGLICWIAPACGKPQNHRRSGISLARAPCPEEFLIYFTIIIVCKLHVCVNYFSFWNAVISSLPSLLATAIAATESPVQFNDVTSISIGRLIARINE